MRESVVGSLAIALLGWKTTYPIGLRMQGSVVILAGLAGIWTWWVSRDWRWVLGAVLIIANWPFTLIVLQPVNAELMALAPEQAGNRARVLIEQWGSRQAVRGGLGILALAAFLWAFNGRRRSANATM
jgi:hypothetical protein